VTAPAPTAHPTATLGGLPIVATLPDAPGFRARTILVDPAGRHWRVSQVCIGARWVTVAHGVEVIGGEWVSVSSRRPPLSRACTTEYATMEDAALACARWVAPVGRVDDQHGLYRALRRARGGGQ
jgi:hypothetical protein